MRKKILFFTAVLLVVCSIVNAQSTGSITLIKKRPTPIGDPYPKPSIPKAPARPLFEAYQTAEQIDVTALTDMGTVQLVVVNRLTGIVYNETHTMGTDAVVSVATYAWASGYYTIHIYYGDNNLLSGDFMLE